jgi:SpoVK/Ycf46/Vps4 family AAA+-type ATPase
MNTTDDELVGCTIRVIVYMVVITFVIYILIKLPVGPSGFWSEILLFVACIGISEFIINEIKTFLIPPPAAHPSKPSTITIRVVSEKVPSDEQTGESSEGYLSLCDDITKKMADYLIKLENDSTFMQHIIQDVTGLEKLDKLNSLSIYHINRMVYIYMADFVVCFRQLGYKECDDWQEVTGLHLFLERTAYGKNELDAQELHDASKQDVDKLNALIAQLFRFRIFDGKEPEAYQFHMPVVISRFAPEYMNEYWVLMYRFASLVAKADNVISESESAWLKGLIRQSSLSKDVLTSLGVDTSELSIAMADSISPNTEAPEYENPQDKLNQLIGLESVKEDVRKLKSYVQIQKVRSKKGMKTSPISYHCVFTGNPGTGKTTVARIVAKIYRDLGILKKGHLVETDRSGLVAEYIGQTAVKTNKIIDAALDGVLFIDEAYSLAQGGSNDYGMEAIATLLKRMEDDRDRLVVILAGYDDEMQVFIESNPGLRSRFNRYIHFPDYNEAELYAILESILSRLDYTLEEGAAEVIRQRIHTALLDKKRTFGNARFVRNMFEKIMENQSIRLASEGELSEESLRLIRKEDVGADS